MQPYLSLRPQAIPLPSDADLQNAIDQELMYLDMMLDTDELDLTIPANFEMNVNTKSRFYTPSPNPQTVDFCKLLGIDDLIGNACPPPRAATQTHAATLDNNQDVSSSAPDQPADVVNETNKESATNETPSNNEQTLPTQEQRDQSPKRQKLD